MSRFKEQRTLKPVGSLQKYLQNSICVHEASFESDIQLARRRRCSAKCSGPLAEIHGLVATYMFRAKGENAWRSSGWIGGPRAFGPLKQQV
jgi:hypothetical protein